MVVQENYFSCAGTAIGIPMCSTGFEDAIPLGCCAQALNNVYLKMDQNALENGLIQNVKQNKIKKHVMIMKIVLGTQMSGYCKEKKMN